MIEKITHNELTLGIIIYNNYKKEGIDFFTPDDFSQQLGYMNRPQGYVIEPHTHNLIERQVTLTQEVLIIKKGKVRVDFYDSDQIYLESRILVTGDIVLLANGGHGFEMLEQSEIIEVKQGPYCGEKDKVRFNQVDKKKIKVKPRLTTNKSENEKR